MTLQAQISAGFQAVAADIKRIDAAGPATSLRIDGGSAATVVPEYLVRLDFGASGATINPSGVT